MLSKSSGTVATNDTGEKVSKLSLSTAVKLNTLPIFLVRFKRLKLNEIVAEQVKFNEHVIGSVYYCLTLAAEDKISSYNLFKTRPIRNFKPNFVHDNDFVRFAGPVIWTEHQGSTYVLCTTNKV